MPLGPRFNEAFLYAADLHSTQTRKTGDVPYLAHLLGVTSLVLDYGGSEDCAIAALLHDAVEDQGGQPTRDEIVRRFGPKVAAIVDGCTDTDVTPKPPWRARKEAHLAHLKTASSDVWLVFAADKLHNGRSLIRALREQGNRMWQSFRGGADGTLWYYRSAVEMAAAAPLPPAMRDELQSVVAELAEHIRATN